MPTYDHRCNICETGVELVISFDEYKKMEDEFGRTKGGNVRFPCDQEGCDGWSERDYSQGVASSIIKGGYKYTTDAYRKGAEENWLRNEVQHTRKVLKGDTGAVGENAKRPYVGYTLDDKGAEDMGFKRVSGEEAKARSEVAKETTGKEVAKVDKARKNSWIED